MERLEPDTASAARSCKYVVARRLGRWRVLRDEQDAGTFSEQDEAIRFACNLARGQARAGVVGVVIVQADVHEMHCFTPPQSTLAAAPQAPARLRVVWGAR